jgi:hypothetical protein
MVMLAPNSPRQKSRCLDRPSNVIDAPAGQLVDLLAFRFDLGEEGPGHPLNTSAVAPHQHLSHPTQPRLEPGPVASSELPGHERDLA